MFGARTFAFDLLSHAYERQLTDPPLVNVMACRLFGTKKLLEPLLKYCQLVPVTKIQWRLNQNTNFVDIDQFNNGLK